MKVKELILLLKHSDPEQEIKVSNQGVSYDIKGIHQQTSLSTDWKETIKKEQITFIDVEWA